MSERDDLSQLKSMISNDERSLDAVKYVYLHIGPFTQSASFHCFYLKISDVYFFKSVWQIECLAGVQIQLKFD